MELPDGSTAVVSSGRRAVVRADGTEDGAPSIASGDDRGMSPLGGVPIPARLGGGYLFWATQLERAPTFLGPRSPVAPLQTNVIDVEFGHDALLLFGPQQSRRAYALDPPRQVPLSPHGVVATAGADDDRVVALDAAGRALVSLDGAKSWKDVTAELHAQPVGVFGEASDVAFVLGQDGVWLARRTGRSCASRCRRRRSRATRRVWPWRRGPGSLVRAVLYGWPLDQGHARMADGAEVVTVDLATGATADARTIGPEKSGCFLLSAEGSGLAVCKTYSVRGRDATDIVADVLGAAHVERSFEHHPDLFSDEGMIVVSVPCDAGDAGAGPQRVYPAPASSHACVRSARGRWDDVDVTAALGNKWQLLRWVARRGGGVAAVVWDGREKPPAMALVDPATGAVTRWDAEVNGATSTGGRWVVERDGSTHGFTPKGSVTVDARGHVEPGARTFVQVAASGERALGRDAEGRLWQTTDGGARWAEVARPPYDAGLPKGWPEPRYPPLECGHVGCRVAHGSGFGSWLRVGWPIDPPHGEGVDVATADVATASDAGADGDVLAPVDAAAPGAAPTWVPPRVPRLVCTSKADVEAGHAPPALPAKPGAIEAPALITGIGGVTFPRPKGAADKAFVTAVYRDRFDGPVGGREVSSTEHALRAVVHFEAGPNVDGHWTVEPDSAIEAVSVPPFDPFGRVLRAAGHLPGAAGGKRPAAGGSAAGSNPKPRRGGEVYGEEQPAAARPVLDARRPGEAAGLLLRAGDRNVWIAPGGAVRLTQGCPGKLETFGGVLDAKGKLLVACEDYSRELVVIDAESGQDVLGLPGILPWVWEPEAKEPFYGGGGATFLPNADAIAVRPDGRLAILRLPSVAPATVDDPAWLLTPGGPPVELAPWSAIEPATSPACAPAAMGSDAVRALIQTAAPWIDVEGARGFWRRPGTTAIVRWGREHVCLEAVEGGYRQINQPGDPRYGAQVMAVARFTGADAGAAFVGMTGTEAFRSPATSRLEP